MKKRYHSVFEGLISTESLQIAKVWVDDSKPNQKKPLKLYSLV
jgi:hypothetical protein